MILYKRKTQAAVGTMGAPGGQDKGFTCINTYCRSLHKSQDFPESL